MNRYCEQKVVALTDKRSSSSRANEDGYVQKIENTSKRFANPRNGVHTQRIEQAWVEVKQ